MPIDYVANLSRAVLGDDLQTVTKIEDLQPNAFIDWSGTGTLTPTAGVKLTGGADGTASGSDFSAALSAFEAYQFNILDPGLLSPSATGSTFEFRLTAVFRDKQKSLALLQGFDLVVLPKPNHIVRTPLTGLADLDLRGIDREPQDLGFIVKAQLDTINAHHSSLLIHKRHPRRMRYLAPVFR
ncbi:hypothetical protein NYE48_23105 [Paenibacillus sp. FSL M7-1455]|uniref:hypothetical protein n=1 Tax=Paenibacillus sp. FSL M7-1455 TaxID=2975316 RepID=UPI0030F544A4